LLLLSINKVKIVNVRSSIVDVGFKALNLSHRTVLKMSAGHVGRSAFGMKAVELRTTGRKSGLTRVTMLTAPVSDEHRIVLVASKGGDDRNPEWYLNLQENPSVSVIINGHLRQMIARTATLDEKTELWPKVVAAYKPYASYQKRSKRDIPLVICENL
jgi:deazaflavin-dependent oxidoreductase (nitroreductase family)